MTVLGIETSCDETAAAVVKDGCRLLSNVIASSMDLHTAYGGVVPEIAAPAQLETILPVIDQALNTARTDWSDIDAIAVTQGPGLSGSLLIGATTARTLAITKKKPLYGVNHVEAHVYAAFLTSFGKNKEVRSEDGKEYTNSQFLIPNSQPPAFISNYIFPKKQPRFPLLALIVSGGHTQLVLFKDHFDYKILGKTADDAVGEAFDKVAKILGLPYPGGPSVAKEAAAGNPRAIKLPEAKMSSRYAFSFSGLKTAVLRATQHLAGVPYDFPSSGLPRLLNKAQKADIAASFQAKAVDMLISRLAMAVEEFQPAAVVIAGGVAANQELRSRADKQLKLPLFYPDIKLCTDNAAMVAALACYKIMFKQQAADPYSLDIQPDMVM